MKRILIAQVVVLFLTTLAAQTFADDMIYGCYDIGKKSRMATSYLRIVSDPGECKKNEKAITICTKCGGTESGYKYKVYDANNQYLGLSNIVHPSIVPTIFIPSLDLEATIAQYGCKSGSFYRGNYLYFEGTDCTGKMYAQAWPGMPSLGILNQYENGSETIFYKSIGDAQYLNDIVKSSYHLMNGCQNSVPECSFGYETEQIPSSSIPFTLPVALPLHFENNN